MEWDGYMGWVNECIIKMDRWRERMNEMDIRCDKMDARMDRQDG